MGTDRQAVAALWSNAATGASLKELMARLGHTSTRAAMIYQHAARDRDEAIAKALGGLLHQVQSDRIDQADGDL
jgi:integrase